MKERGLGPVFYFKRGRSDNKCSASVLPSRRVTGLIFGVGLKSMQLVESGQQDEGPLILPFRAAALESRKQLINQR